MSPYGSFADNRLPFLIGVAALVFVAGYAFYAALPILAGPSLSMESPVPYQATSSSRVLVSGSTERVQFLWINGNPVALSENGSFAVLRSIPAGYTEFVIKADDRFGRSTEAHIPVLALHTNLSTTTHDKEQEAE